MNNKAQCPMLKTAGAPVTLSVALSISEFYPPVVRPLGITPSDNKSVIVRYFV